MSGPERPQLALAGRSNVGKSSLINALCRQRVARTSGTPGKTRLVNFYRAQLKEGSNRPRVLYFVDLPGYGFTRGQRESFGILVDAYFARFVSTGTGTPLAGVLLLVDARHPGLPQDLQARDWLQAQGASPIVVGTKIDALPRAAKQRAQRELEERFNVPVVATSAQTGEGLDVLWKLITRLITTPTQSPNDRHVNSRH